MDHWHPTETVTRLAPLVRALVAAVVDGPAHTPSAMRRSICEGTHHDPKLRAYVEKIRNSSYRISPSDIDALRASGFSDHAIFEVTIAAALGEALRRLRHGLRVLGMGG